MEFHDHWQSFRALVSVIHSVPVSLRARASNSFRIASYENVAACTTTDRSGNSDPSPVYTNCGPFIKNDCCDLREVFLLFLHRRPNTRDRRQPINARLERRQSISTTATSDLLCVVISPTICFLLVFFRRPTAGDRKETHDYRISPKFRQLGIAFAI